MPGSFPGRLSARLAGAALFLTAALPALAEPVKITFLGVGDTYNFAEEDGRGGFARLNAVARAEREANPNTLYLFDGDMLSPSLEQVLTTLVLGGDSSRRLALAVRPRTVATAFRGVVPALSARATAVLLGDIGRHDGEPLGVQFEPTLTRCPGRGLLVVRGRVEEIQVALAEAPPSD